MTKSLKNIEILALDSDDMGVLLLVTAPMPSTRAELRLYSSSWSAGLDRKLSWATSARTNEHRAKLPIAGYMYCT